MSKRLERPVEGWPKAQARRVEKKTKERKINRLSSVIHRWLVMGVSNLRLSLTLRIALHYAGQLLRTTLPMMAALVLALCLMEVPEASQALESLAAFTPENGKVYTRQQLLETPFEQAEMTDFVVSSGFSGFAMRMGMLLSDTYVNGEFCITLLKNTPTGSLHAHYRVTRLFQQLCVVMAVFLCIDLYRVLYFLNHRNRLNRKVLKPISDMAETAATLSANNLSDRISVEGAKNELKDLALVINGMLDRIEVSYNSQKQFVSDASHELRTPIAVIQGYVGMLQRWGKEDREVLDEGINAIAQETSSMKELVERLLFLARHDKKTLMLETESFDPLEVMSEIHREAKMLSDKHTFELNPAQNAWVNGDKDMIKQLMRILLDNAIKYTPEGGSITLGVRQEKERCILTVSDTGEGISAEDMPKVFERFYRCDGARKAQTSGHGLGLSIARIIVSAHGGELKVRSKVGVGTTFSVLLPLEEPLSPRETTSRA